jgi:polysaccharide pyruvyl transferase WcaK-like protein
VLRPDRQADAVEQARAYLADVADHIVEEQDMGVALLCMEQLDEPLARKVHALMSCRDRARVFSSREHTASRMTAVLRDLDLLVTSRYHAAVLSLASQVPMVALGHDLRLRTLFADLGIADRLFIEHCSADRCGNVKTIVDSLDSQRQQVSGVSLDEEAANLVRWQQAFQASARFLQTVNAVIESTLQLLTPTV